MTDANAVGACFGEANAPVLLVRPVRDARFAVTRLRCRLDGELSRRVCLPADDAYFLMFYVKDAMHCDVTRDGSDDAIQRYRQGSICLVDLAQGATVRLVSDLDALAFHLPRTLFREVSEFSHAPSMTGLRCLRGETDDVMLNLALALEPLFGEDGADPSPVLQHIAVAICAHLLHSYPERAVSGNAALSVWQEKAAKDFMIDHWSDDFSLAGAAAATRLSEDDLVARFLAATGQTPQQWLLRYRIGRAKHALAEDAGPLAAIAARCGFADEADFIDAFRTVTGVSPAIWRARWRH
ncbi:AraC family transcriptional regulator [Ensifer sp.]|jgi:AraC-like DNA-binding protein|uniref:AraC family transcriptional regulator n=1 Tax=Ensifer sp. TaxID=1872086 RepID=UPI002E13B5C8|nr:AraC family transcriptional regulator [Ensifer sp.]